MIKDNSLNRNTYFYSKKNNITEKSIFKPSRNKIKSNILIKFNNARKKRIQH